MKTLMPTNIINNKISSYKDFEREVGGYVNLIVKRRRDDILYFIVDFGESVKESGVVSAVISSSTPHIWHLHPKNMGAFLSYTDRNDLLRNAALQALTFQGIPPLSLVVSFHTKKTLSDIVFYSSAGFVAWKVNGDIFEIKGYVANVDKSCFEIREGDKVSENLQFDEEEGLLLESKPVSYSFIKFLMERCSNYPASLISIFKSLNGIYSPGIKPDPIDLMRTACLINTLKRFEVKRNDLKILKMGSGRMFSAALIKELNFVVEEVKVYILDEEVIKLLMEG
jgi:hypothetical protein